MNWMLYTLLLKSATDTLGRETVHIVVNGSAHLDRFFPPWTARHQIWADALKPCHSGVSTDVLLFREMNLSLIHHYRVFRRGLPHFALCKDYCSRLQMFVSQASAMAQCALSFPAPASSGSLWSVRPCDAEI